MKRAFEATMGGGAMQMMGGNGNAMGNAKKAFTGMGGNFNPYGMGAYGMGMGGPMGMGMMGGMGAYGMGGMGGMVSRLGVEAL